MPGVSFFVDPGFEPIRQHIDRLSTQVDDMSDFFEDVGLAITASTIRRMNQGLRPDGQPQKPVNRGGTPLVDTGVHLRDTMTYGASRGSVESGTNSVIGAIHQFGGKTGRNKSTKIDERPYLGLSTDDVLEIEALTLEYLDV